MSEQPKKPRWKKRADPLKDGTKFEVKATDDPNVVTVNGKPVRFAHRKQKRVPPPKFMEKAKQYHWKPGQSGNPLGKQSRGSKLISEAYTLHLQDREPTTGLTYAELIAIAQVEVATNTGLKNSTAAAKEIREVTEGKLPDTVNVQGELKGTLVVDAKAKLLGKLLPLAGGPGDAV